ncbi:hypothetical protein H4219_003913 [Mycoemilia scoparia]|uniref:Uncharacterized protein n=1 Tax=Mycoemilia scoparia TaxID=417184 RepID=A0A9W7ZTR2_9FUNG|nr:hypothetical protein H4219_003913 [Mycoemilia scoparia]
MNRMAEDIFLDIEAQIMAVLDVWESLDVADEATTEKINSLAHDFNPFYGVMNSAKFAYQRVLESITDQERKSLYLRIDQKTLEFMDLAKIVLNRVYNLFNHEASSRITNEEEMTRFKKGLEMSPEVAYNELTYFIDVRKRYFAQDQNFHLYYTVETFYEILDDIQAMVLRMSYFFYTIKEAIDKIRAYNRPE